MVFVLSGRILLGVVVVVVAKIMGPWGLLVVYENLGEENLVDDDFGLL